MSFKQFLFSFLTHHYKQRTVILLFVSYRHLILPSCRTVTKWILVLTPGETTLDGSVKEGAERPCILIGSTRRSMQPRPYIRSEGCSRWSQDAYAETLLSIHHSPLSLSLSRSFSRLFFFFLILLSILVRWLWYEIPHPSAPCQGQPAFRGYSYSGLKVPEKMITNPAGVSYRVKFYRRHISSGDRFITGAKRDSRAKNSVWRSLGVRGLPSVWVCEWRHWGGEQRFRDNFFFFSIYIYAFLWNLTRIIASDWPRSIFD